MWAWRRGGHRRRSTGKRVLAMSVRRWFTAPTPITDIPITGATGAGVGAGAGGEQPSQDAGEVTSPRRGEVGLPTGRRKAPPDDRLRNPGQGPQPSRETETPHPTPLPMGEGADLHHGYRT